MRKQFYSKVLPSSGLYCVTAIGPSGTIQKFVSSIDELEEQIERSAKPGINLFVALASFSKESRKADDAAFLRSFFVDLDVGENKGYPSKEAAVSAIAHAISQDIFPPPVVIDSGNGVHAYWIFSQDIPRDVWKPYAEKFKRYVSKHLKIDPTITADISRILRVPGTLNYKSNPPKTTGFLGEDLDVYEFESVKEILDAQQVKDDSVLQILQSAPRGLDDDSRAVSERDWSNYEHKFSDILEKCAQIKYLYDHQDKIQEPLWRAGLSIAWHCEDRDRAIHRISKKHPTYTPEETTSKAELTQGMPQGCERFEEHNPGGCDKCPHRGKITNPLVLGRKFLAAPTVEELAFNTEDGSTPEPAAPIIAFPKDLFPFMRGANGGIYYQPEPTTNKEGKTTTSEPVKLWANDVIPIRRTYNGTEGECLVVQHHMPKDGIREFVLPMSLNNSMDKVSQLLSTKGVHTKTITNKTLFMQYFVLWATHLQNTTPADLMRMQMGWTEDNNTFVIGKTEILRNGKRRHAATSPMVASIAQLLEPKGSYEAWKKSAKNFNKLGFERHAFGFLTGFGSPLMRFMSTRGGIVSIISNATGSGKTATLNAALSIFGNPVELCTAGEKSATDNALVSLFLTLHSLALGMDEVTNKTPEMLSETIHRITQGKGKLRMQGSVNALRELEMSASMLALMTANSSMRDKLESRKHSPDGEMARILELSISCPAIMTQAWGRAAFDPMRYNYGHAGPVYVDHLFKVGEQRLSDLCLKWASKASVALGGLPAYRFFENTIGACMAGGELAIEAGIIDLDLDRIFKTVIDSVVTDKGGGHELNKIDYQSVLGEFMQHYQSGFLVVNSGRVVSEPSHTALIGRTEIHNSVVFIDKNTLKKFLHERRINIGEFEKAMYDDKILIYVGRQRLSTGWKNGNIVPAVGVYGFRSAFPDEILKDAPAETK